MKKDKLQQREMFSVAVNSLLFSLVCDIPWGTFVRQIFKKNSHVPFALQWISIWVKVTCVCSPGRPPDRLGAVLLTRLFLFLNIEEISFCISPKITLKTLRLSEDGIEFQSGLESGPSRAGPTVETDWDNLCRCLYLYSFWVNGHQRPYLRCGLNVKWVLERQILKGKIVE